MIQLYGVYQNDITTVSDAARHHLFLNKGKGILQLPPNSDDLQQHLLRVAYQSGYVWGNMLRKCFEPVPVKQWGWQQNTPQSAPTPLYTTKPVLSKKIPDLVSFKCIRNKHRLPHASWVIGFTTCGFSHAMGWPRGMFIGTCQPYAIIICKPEVIGLSTVSGI